MSINLTSSAIKLLDRLVEKGKRSTAPDVTDETKDLEFIRTAVAALIARNAELEADRDHLLTSLRIIRDYEFFGGDEWLQAVEVLQKMAGNAIAHNEKAQAARAEAASHG